MTCTGAWRVALAVACFLVTSAPAALACDGPNVQPRQQALDLAAAVISASGVDSSLGSIDDTVVNTLEDQVSSITHTEETRPGGRPEWRPALEDAIRDQLKKRGDAIIQTEACLYASKFSEAQLNDMLTFYRSPAGRALVTATPIIARENPALVSRPLTDIWPDLVAAACAGIGCKGRPTPGAPLRGPRALLEQSWASRPSVEEATLLTPPVLMGDDWRSVDLSCRIGSAGRLEDCVVDRDERPRIGLDTAALKAIKLCRLKLRLFDESDATGLYAKISMTFSSEIELKRFRIRPNVEAVGVSMADLVEPLPGAAAGSDH